MPPNTSARQATRASIHTLAGCLAAFALAACSSKPADHARQLLRRHRRSQRSRHRDRDRLRIRCTGTDSSRHDDDDPGQPRPRAAPPPARPVDRRQDGQRPGRHLQPAGPPTIVGRIRRRAKCRRTWRVDPGHVHARARQLRHALLHPERRPRAAPRQGNGATHHRHVSRERIEHGAPTGCHRHHDGVCLRAVIATHRRHAHAAH